MDGGGGFVDGDLGLDGEMAAAPIEDEEGNPGGGGENHEDGHDAFGIKKSHAGGSERGRADLQEAQKGRGAADVFIEWREGHGSGIRISEPQTRGQESQEG